MSPMNVPSLGRGVTVSTQHVGGGEPLNSGHADLEVGHDVGEADVEERFVEGGDEGGQGGRKHDCQQPVFCWVCGRGSACGRRRSHEASLRWLNRIGFGGVGRFTCGRSFCEERFMAALRVSYSRPQARLPDRWTEEAVRVAIRRNPLQMSSSDFSAVTRLAEFIY